MKNIYNKIEFEMVRIYKTKANYAKVNDITRQKLNYILNKLKNENISIKELKNITSSLNLELVINVKRNI